MSSLSQQIAEVETLACALYEGEIDAKGQVRLEQLLRESEMARQTYAEYLNLVAALNWADRSSDLGVADELNEVGELAVAPRVLPTSDELVEGASAAHRVWDRFIDLASDMVALSLVISAIFMAILLLSMGLVSVPQPAPGPRPIERTDFVARVTRTHGASWSPQSEIEQNKVSDLYIGQQIDLLTGFAEVQFNSGAKVNLQAPATLVIRGDGDAILRQGVLTAQVPAQAVGFTISTAVIQVIDLGTEFGVAVTEDGGADLRVFEGKVEAMGLDANGRPIGKPIQLVAGEATHASRRGGGATGGVTFVAASGTGSLTNFVRGMPGTQTLLADIRDDYRAAPTAGATSAEISSNGAGRWNYYEAKTTTADELVLLEWDPVARNYSRPLDGESFGEKNRFVQVGTSSNFRQEIETNEIFVHPSDTDSQGNDAVYGVVRWTTGKNTSGTVRIRGKVRHPASADDGSDLRIMVDGRPLFQTEPLLAAERQFDVKAIVKAGSTIDFVVGPNRDHFSDSTLISAKIYQIFERPPVESAVDVTD